MHSLRRISRYASLTRRCASTSSTTGSGEAVAAGKDKTPDKAFRHLSPSQILADTSVPIEKKSLSRGMALNRFEKDFLIYPEYTNMADLNNIKGYLQKLGHQLDVISKKTDVSKQDREEVLLDNRVYSALVRNEFGGLGFCIKDKLLLAETLASRDMSLFVNVNVVQLVIKILEAYAQPAVRDKYLKSIASGRCKPALCILDDTAEDMIETKVTAGHGHQGILDGRKINVINGDSADVLFIIARNRIGDEDEKFCYILDLPLSQDDAKTGSVEIVKTKTLQGLDGSKFSNIEFKNVPVTPENVLGDSYAAADIVSDYLTTNRTFYGAAVVGFLKQTCGLCMSPCHDQLYGTKTLAENPAVAKTMSDLCQDIYVLDTLVYYIGGLQDEGLFLLNDVEHSIIQRYANRVLRQGILTITEIAGISSVDAELNFEKRIRDAATLLSLNLPELTLVRAIMLPVIDSYMHNTPKNLTLTAQTTLRNALFGRNADLFLNPVAKHYIAEHAHPSLETCCRILEENTCRVSALLEKVCVSSGTELRGDFYTLSAAANVLEMNLAMLATIARSSRSYSIGLHNADLEIHWTNTYCGAARKHSIENLDGLINHLDLVTLNPSLTTIGKTVMNCNGYPIESVLERNW